VAKRYIAGIALSDGVRVANELNKKTMMATMDLLGEDVKNAVEIEEVKNGILSILQSVKRTN